MTLIASDKHSEAAVYRATIGAGEPFLCEVKAGQTLRLLDLEGNQAVDTLFYSARNPRERYDVQRTLRKQNRVYLTTGSVLYSNLGQPMPISPSARKVMRDMNAPIMKISPCAKLIMPTMPYTIV
jgi:uncharacterized protein YcgI (DUF1989 family)